MSTAGIYNLCIDKGTTFGPVTFRLKDKETNTPISLVGLDVRAKIRSSYTESTTLVDLTATITDAANGAMTIELPSTTDIPDNISPLSFAQIKNWATKLTLSNEERKLFNTGLAPYVWDLETYDAADPPVVIRRLNGLVAVTSEVTSG
ncbi:hypothetical protein U2F10_02780 [Leptothoe sp. EHU-05/26/07-4]